MKILYHPINLPVWTNALIKAGLVTMEAQLWAYERGLNNVITP